MDSFKSLKDILQSNYGAQHRGHPKKQKVIKEAFDFLNLIKSWPKIVGDRLASRTIPLKNQYKTLTILSNHSAFSEQLSFMSDKIIEKINHFYPELQGYITQIKFITNPSHFQSHQVRAKKLQGPNPAAIKEITHKFSPFDRNLLKEADHIFKDIEDEKVRKSLESIFIQLHKSP